MSDPAIDLSKCPEGRPCDRLECPEHMTHVVTAAMRARPLEGWPITCGLELPRGPLKLEEVGQILGCTRERVRQIEEQAIAKLLKPATREVGKNVFED